MSRMEDMGNEHKILVGKSEGMRTFVDVGLNGKTILKWIVRK
jgi:hypothetical protein